MAKFHEIIQHDALLCLWCDIKHDKKKHFVAVVVVEKEHKNLKPHKIYQMKIKKKKKYFFFYYTCLRCSICFFK